MYLQGLAQKIEGFDDLASKQPTKVKLRYFLLFLLKYSVCPVLATSLWLLRWKRRTLLLNLDVCRGLSRGPSPTPGRPKALLFFWYQCLCRDAVRVLLGCHEIPIRVRPRDQAKLSRLKSTPTLFLTGHFHNWEALAAWMVDAGIPLLGSARPLASPLAQAWLQRLRRRNHVPVVSQRVLPTALGHLQAGGCFGVLWDQFSPWSRHASHFFGQAAAMDPLPEILVRRRRPEVLVGVLLPTGDFRIVSIYRSIQLLHPERLSSRYHRVMEKVINAYPTFWYGLCHARFKTFLDYGRRGDVSRETSPGNFSPDPQVSRETLSEKSTNSRQG